MAIVGEIGETGSADVRTRMLDAALELTWRGGYEALSVRALAERANVSSRTIYAHFPSLDALLITAIADASEDFYGSLAEAPFAGSSAVERVNRLTTYLIETMTASRFLTVAVVRALVSGKPDVTLFVQKYEATVSALLASAIATDEPTDKELAAAEILANVWFSAVVGWATRGGSPADIRAIMDKTARAVLSSDSGLTAPIERDRGHVR
jgi:AcrR family transcriptional regulator